MVKIEIVSTTVNEKAGTAKRTGKQYHIREQGAYVHVLDEAGKPARYPVACVVPLEEDAPPYQPGMYQIDPRSVYVGDFQRVQIGRLRLMALPK